MFKKILVPVSSEYFPKKAMEKALEMSNYFKADVKVMYIIEEKVEDKVKKTLEYVRTEFQRQEMTKDIHDAQKREYNDTMERWKEQFSTNIEFTTSKIVEGNYSAAIAEELEKYAADLIILEAKQECILRYNLFYEDDDIPILIVR